MSEPVQHAEPVLELHKIILMHHSDDRHILPRKIAKCEDLLAIDSRTQNIAEGAVLKSRKVSGEVSGDLTISWGGKEGVTVSGGGSGEIRDDNGNYAKGEVRQNSNGEGSATISAGHREEER